jgi:hypothetical protein
LIGGKRVKHKFIAKRYWKDQSTAMGQSDVAAISISGPTTRLRYKGADYLKDLLVSTAQEISKVYSKMFNNYNIDL